MSVDLISQTDLSSPDFEPSFIGKRTTFERKERFSQDIPPVHLYRLKLAPKRREKWLSVRELKRNGRWLENSKMESTYHPCMYIPHDDIEFQPYLQHLVLGTEAQAKQAAVFYPPRPIHGKHSTMSWNFRDYHNDDDIRRKKTILMIHMNRPYTAQTTTIETKGSSSLDILDTRANLEDDW